jgi:hypothetical protein
MSNSADENGPHWADKLSILFALIAICLSNDFRLLVMSMEKAVEASICGFVVCRQPSRVSRKPGTRRTKKTERPSNNDEPFIDVDCDQEETFDQIPSITTDTPIEFSDGVMCDSSLEDLVDSNTPVTVRDVEDTKPDDQVPPPDSPPPEQLY